MTLNQLASKIAKLEGKKSEVSIGNIREILGILSDLTLENPEITMLLLINGSKRKKKNASKR